MVDEICENLTVNKTSKMLGNMNELDRTWVKLNFEIEHQQQTQWCWAAVTVSICKFFNPNCIWTQCSLVNSEFGRNDCCDNGSSNDCDQPWYPDKALNRVGIFRSQSYGATSFDNVMKEINNGNPISVGIFWDGGGGHNVSIDGFNSFLKMVAIEDPWYGFSTVSLDAFKSAYKGSGTWVHTYYVKPEEMI